MTDNPFTTEGKVEDKQDTSAATPEKEKDKDPTQGLGQLVPGLQVEESQAPTELTYTNETDPHGKYVKYVGDSVIRSTLRIMDQAAWKAAHVDPPEGKDYHEWNYLNNMRLPMSAFTDEQLKYLLRIDGRFELVEDDGKAKADN